MRTVPAVTSDRSTWISPLPSTLNVIRRGIASGAIESSMPIRLNVASRAVASPSTGAVEVGLGLGPPVDGGALAVEVVVAVALAGAVEGRTVDVADAAADGLLEAWATDEGVGDGVAGRPETAEDDKADHGQHGDHANRDGRNSDLPLADLFWIRIPDRHLAAARSAHRPRRSKAWRYSAL